MNALLDWLRGPRFDDPELNERAAVINFTLVLGLGFLSLLSVLYLTTPQLRMATLTLLPVFVILLASKALLHRGAVGAAAWLPVGTLVLAVTPLSFMAGGYDLGLPPIFVLFALMGALMLGRNVGLFLTGWAIAVQLAVYGLGSSDEWFILDADPFTILVAVTIAQTSMIGFVVSWVVGRLRDEAARARQQAKSLAENQILLEQSVREADAASQAKSRFLATMSHELRTPLNAILGYSELLLEDLASTAEHEDVERIHRSGTHLLSLVNDVLDMSKIEAGQMHLDLELVDVPGLIQESIQTIRPVATERNTTIHVDVDSTLPLLWLDRRKVRQILLNLLSNAAKFTENGRIVVKVDNAGGRLGIAISDTGIGIPSDQIDRLFRPFEQADNSSRRRHGGTGLGLTISRHFAKMMQGGIDVSSTLGEGSTFRVWIPDLSDIAHATSLQRPRVAASR
ncbi:MAG: ATP-binding protein [Myxococcota bacterium]